ncbi:MAG: DUF86 domain-containing protein [Candidatus Gracilibacteria bacterium]
MKKILKIIKGFKKYSLTIIEEDLLVKGAVERYLYLLCQASIDLAEAVITYKHLRKPTTYKETFEILSEENIITPKLREKLISMVGFRNIVAHDYVKIDYKIAYEIIHEKLKDIEDFIKKIAIKLNV